MSESDKSGKQELSKKDRKSIDKFIDMVINNDGQEYELADAAEWGILHERSAAQARIAELEAISKALIKTLQVSLPIVSAPLRETFEIAIAKAKDKLLKP